MKYAIILLFAYITLPVFLCAQTGSSCSSPYPLILDGVNRNFVTASVNDVAKVCTSYIGSSPVTWFSFTTNSQAETPLLDISAADGGRCEIAMYTACNGNETNILQTTSSMCFDDGAGLWAPSETFAVAASKTYLLRIKTAGATSLAIAAKSYTPANNSCNGAFSIGATTLKDNNACNKPGQGITPDQICAYTIENTAFYQYYVASTGNTIINISSIACDNGNGNNSNGFQIGFFTGSCSSLTPLNCTSGDGNFVQATTPVLQAGTKVYVAIDGNAGSNCQYNIAAINAYGVLADGFKNFSAWKKYTSNFIKWTMVNDNAAYYEIERSGNGRDFSVIGKLNSAVHATEKVDYSFEDDLPTKIAYYRLKQIDNAGKISLSNVLKLVRDDKDNFEINIINPVRNNLTAKISTAITGTLDYAIINYAGQLINKGKINVSNGVTLFYKSISQLPNGKYIFKVSTNEAELSKPFFKIN